MKYFPSKKAIYDTTHHRIPIPLKTAVQAMCSAYRSLVSEDRDYDVYRKVKVDISDDHAEVVLTFTVDLKDGTVSVKPGCDYLPDTSKSSTSPINSGISPQDIERLRLVIDEYQKREKRTRNWVEASRLLNDLLTILS